MSGYRIGLAGGLGFEPRLTESESAVLPLNYPPKPVHMPPRWGGRISPAFDLAQHRVCPGAYCCLSDLPLRNGIVPPRAGAWHEPVVAFDNLYRNSHAVFGELCAHGASLGALVFRQPSAFVAPQAGASGVFLRAPVVWIDDAAAPAILDHEAGRRPRIK